MYAWINLFPENSSMLIPSDNSNSHIPSKLLSLSLPHPIREKAKTIARQVNKIRRFMCLRPQSFNMRGRGTDRNPRPQNKQKQRKSMEMSIPCTVAIQKSSPDNLPRRKLRGIICLQARGCKAIGMEGLSSVSGGRVLHHPVPALRFVCC